MPGMGTGLSANNQLIVSAFHAALLRQGLIVLVILALVGLLWNILRALQVRRATAAAGAAAGTVAAGTVAAGTATGTVAVAGGGGPALLEASAPYVEPVARRLLRISFGLIWIFDGVLQGQAAMPLGLVPQAIQPTAASSPAWVQHLVNAGATVWTYHPVSAAAASVWIQIGIGIWLVAAPRGYWSRLGGLASVLWGLVVWAFGEAFGGVFAPGLTWLFGAPGAVLFYCFAGVLIALPERSWRTPRLGRVTLRIMGAFFVGMAVLQAWPGRGFWEGQPLHVATPGALTSMVQQMSQTPQPGFLASWVAGFAGFDAAHGWGVNLFAVVALAAIGLAFAAARPRMVRVAVVAATVLCLADWVLIEDLGFFGGVGTDPNSMIPMALVFIAGYVALVRQPAVATEAADGAADSPSAAGSWRDRLDVLNPIYALRTVIAFGAIAITLVGAVPMALAATNPNASPILAQALDGTPQATHNLAPAFTLTDQFGKSVSLAGLRGKAIALTFLDPTCTSDCPFIAQDFKIADGMLGSEASHVEMVAINVNPEFITTNFLVAFDRQEDMQHLSNWLFLTGSLAQLRQVWSAYGVIAAYLPGGAMIDHSEIAYVIDPSGRSRYVTATDPGQATEATTSSFASELAGSIKSVLAPS